MAEDSYNTICQLVELARNHYQGLVTVEFPDVVDLLHIEKAREQVVGIARKINEPVVLSMGDVEQMYEPDRDMWLPPIDRINTAVVSDEDMDFKMTMSGAAWKEPEILLDVAGGASLKLARIRLQELHDVGLRSIKGNWMEEQAPTTPAPVQGAPRMRPS